MRIKISRNAMIAVAVIAFSGAMVASDTGDARGFGGGGFHGGGFRGGGFRWGFGGFRGFGGGFRGGFVGPGRFGFRPGFKLSPLWIPEQALLRRSWPRARLWLFMLALGAHLLGLAAGLGVWLRRWVLLKLTAVPCRVAPAAARCLRRCASAPRAVPGDRSGRRIREPGRARTRPSRRVWLRSSPLCRSPSTGAAKTRRARPLLDRAGPATLHGRQCSYQPERDRCGSAALQSGQGPVQRPVGPHPTFRRRARTTMGVQQRRGDSIPGTTWLSGPLTRDNGS